MALSAGTRLGCYEIVSAIGAGGMGEVYRARDTKLGRDVAVKVLPDSLARDPQRLARFEREAHLLATLNHPHIAHIHGFDDSTGTPALVMELVEGPTLAERLGHGAVPLDEALPIARQIADALDAAHWQGIVHRDLKPANIKVRSDGMVKILDFGLAKLVSRESGRSDGSGARDGLTQSPTLTTPAATLAGVVLGTAAYMAPEQARGKPVDKRADIWAFGCVLFEMLTGRRAFAADEVTETLAFIITKEVDWSALPPSTPPAIRRLLRRCIEKDPTKRLHDIADARIELDDAAAKTDESFARPVGFDAQTRRWLPLVAATLASNVIVGVGVWALTRPAPSAPRVVRLQAALPAGATLSNNPFANAIAISPDGKYLAYVVGTGESQLFVRSLDRNEATPVAHGNIRGAFMSPDGEWIAYFENTSLKKVSSRGGPTLTICQTCAAGNRGGSWGPDDTIVFAATRGANGLLRVPAGGGEPVALTTPDRKQGEQGHAWPHFLPSGRAVLFTVLADDGIETSIAVRDLKTGTQKILVRGGSYPHYTATGHIVYGASGGLRAVAFDANRLAVDGSPFPVLEHVLTKSTGAADFSISRDGSLAYVSGDAQEAVTLAWIDRQGHEQPTGAPSRSYAFVSLSPDGQRVALDVRDQQNDIWIWDFSRRVLTRLTNDPGTDQFPVWTPDGQRVAFASNRSAPGGVISVFWQTADGTGAAEQLANSTGGGFVWPSGFSPDGKTLVIRVLDAKTNNDVGIVAIDGDHVLRKLIASPFNEANGTISPDGRWIAYQSDESGREEIHVRPFPDVNVGHWQVSPEGGFQPVWARGGTELFYADPRGRIMSVPVKSAATFEYGNPVVVVEQGSLTGGTFGRSYEVSPDGKRSLVLRSSARTDEKSNPAQVNVILNWSEELKQRVPTK